MANSQDIEARLCRYVDGEMDSAERLDIERHLLEQPQYRQMLEDLIRTRSLIGDLPRSKVPVELGEGLQGQIERAMLLGDGEALAEPWRVQARRLPRITALAAVLALTIGLGLVVLYLLRAATRPTDIATVVAPLPEDTPDPNLASDSPSTALRSTTLPSGRALLTATLLTAAPATQPATQPVVQVAVASPTTRPARLIQPTIPIVLIPATQPAGLAAAKPTAVNPPATMPIAISPQTQPSTQPARVVAADATANAAAPLEVKASDKVGPRVSPSTPTTDPVAPDDDDQ